MLRIVALDGSIRRSGGAVKTRRITQCLEAASAYTHQCVNGALRRQFPLPGSLVFPGPVVAPLVSQSRASGRYIHLHVPRRRRAARVAHLAEEQLSSADVVRLADYMGQGEQQPVDERGLVLALPPGQDRPAARMPSRTPLIVGQAAAPVPAVVDKQQLCPASSRPRLPRPGRGCGPRPGRAQRLQDTGLRSSARPPRSAWPRYSAPVAVLGPGAAESSARPPRSTSWPPQWSSEAPTCGDAG